MEAIANGYINWDVDWSNCFKIQPKRDKMRWCQTCFEDHDRACFFRFKGSWLGCMLHKGNRGKAIAKIKGGAQGIKK